MISRAGVFAVIGFMALPCAALAQAASADATSVVAREKLGEVKEGDALAREAQRKPRPAAMGDAAVQGKNDYNRAGSQTMNFNRDIDMGNNHSTGASAVVRSGVGVSSEGMNNNVTGVNNSGLR